VSGPADRSAAPGPSRSGAARSASRNDALFDDRAAERLEFDEVTPLFVISVAAQLAGMHPQTLRQYDRLGLVSPGRTSGRGRRYSQRDVALLREVQRLSQEGVSLAGIKMILDLQTENDRLRSRVADLAAEVEVLRARSAPGPRVFAAGPTGDVVAMTPGRRPAGERGALVVWRPRAYRGHL